jgi:hypothetical protein
MMMEKLVEWLAGKPKYSEKTCPNATFVHHKIPHDHTRVLNPGPPRWEAGD